jgi:glycosyltransferase involved in cell wall biosynthesis
MNFALLTGHNGSSWGGSEELWSASALRLAQSRHIVRVAVPPPYSGHPRLTELRAAGVDVTVLDSPPLGSGRRFARRLLPARWQTPPVDPLRRWIDRCQAERAFLFISLPGFRSNLQRLVAAGVGRMGYAFVAHGYHPTDWIPDTDLPLYQTFFYGAAFAGFVSADGLAHAQRALGRDLPNGRIVRNPFRVDWGRAPEFPADREALRIAMVGALDCGTKGQDLVIDVLAREKWRTRPVTLTCYGSGVNGGLIASWTQRLGLTNLRLAGHASELPAVWAQAHLGLMASRYEGMPIAMVEGMLCARPFVATAVGGCVELVREGHTGFLASRATADDLDAALERAWDARASLPALGRHARDHVRTLVPRDPAAEFADLLVATATRP